VKLNMANTSVNLTNKNITVSSQSSDLDKEALDEIEKKAQAKNTSKLFFLIVKSIHCLHCIFYWCYVIYL
jgi:hypothetical protein